MNVQPEMCFLVLFQRTVFTMDFVASQNLELDLTGQGGWPSGFTRIAKFGGGAKTISLLYEGREHCAVGSGRWCQ